MSTPVTAQPLSELIEERERLLGACGGSRLVDMLAPHPLPRIW